MFPISPSTKKLEQISEQVSNPIQIPITINNGVYMLIQQDVRKIIDTRYVSVKKLKNDGQMEDAPEIMQASDTAVFDLLNFAQNMQKNCNVNNICQDFCKSFQNSQSVSPSLQEQLCWQNLAQIQTPTQFNFSKRTSTTDLKKPRKSVTFRDDLKTCNCCCCKCEKSFKCRGVNTEIGSNYMDDDDDDEKQQNARQQIKNVKSNLTNFY